MFHPPTTMLSRPGAALGRPSPHHAPAPAARRCTPEQDEPRRSIKVGCWSGDEFIVADARLVSLGRDGLMAIVNGAIRNGQTVWLRLDGVDSPENVRTTVLASNWLRHGRCAVRLALPEVGPAGFYEALARSFSGPPRSLSPAREGAGRRPPHPES